MRKLILGSLIVCAALIGANAWAQAPEAVPEKMPNDIPYGTSINLEQAKAAVAAAEAEAKKRDWKMAIAIVDPNGDPVLFMKMDSTQLASTTIAQGKARTAARFRRPSIVFFKAMETGHPYVATLDPGVVASGGGNLLMANGKIIGAIGVSGGTGAQDDVISQAGARALK